eukprot:1193007-Prorocentrum_minimum.AAC.3
MASSNPSRQHGNFCSEHAAAKKQALSAKRVHEVVPNGLGLYVRVHAVTGHGDRRPRQGSKNLSKNHLKRVDGEFECGFLLEPSEVLRNGRLTASVQTVVYDNLTKSIRRQRAVRMHEVMRTSCPMFVQPRGSTML